MGAQQSTAELLYQQVNYGNIEGIKALHRDGAGLEWIDKEGKTPLILACMRPDLLPVAKILLELGANVNAYRPGSHAGTPFHHAAKRGLEQTVNLLLSHGAHPLVMNDDCQTPLDLARAKGHCNVVRAIESRICLFSGWLREFYGPSFLEALAPQWVSRKIWAVVLPCDSRYPMKPLKFELAIYPELQVAQPRTVIGLWKVNIDEPKFNQADPTLVIVDKATRTRYKFLSAHEGDKQQLQWFYNACRGMQQVHAPTPATPASAPMPNPSQPNSLTSATSTGLPTATSEDIELAMAINASIQSAIAEGMPPFPDVQPVNESIDTSGWGSSSESSTHNGWGPPAGPSPSKESTQAQPVEPAADPYNGWAGPEGRQPIARPSGCTSQLHESQTETTTIPSAQETLLPTVSLPSAPILDETFYDGPIHYPAIDSSPVDLTVPVMEIKPGTSEVKDGGDTSDSCVICLDAPVEGACIPCGHMAGCMSCLSEIKGKQWGCPVCRAKIDQVIKLYAV